MVAQTLILRKLTHYKLFVMVAALLVILAVGQASHQQKNPPAAQTKNQFNKQQYPIGQSNSLWAIVNKGRALPSTYIPGNLVNPKVSLRLPASDPEMKLRSDAAGALESMFADAAAHNIKLMLGSGYRSYSEQVQVYSGNVKKMGISEADQSSARPGHSEHQTGLAADIEPIDRSCEFEICFASTSEGKWLASNSYRYGFILRYRKDTENLTGYQYEPWHARYVGTDLANQIHNSKQTLEQFFGLSPAVNYPLHDYALQ